MKRKYTAALLGNRCKADIKLKDGSGAQCQRASVAKGLCRQHFKMRETFSCPWCGSGRDDQAGHTVDCENPKKS